MRISNNYIIEPYQRALQELQSRKMYNQMALTTGQKISSIADDPKDMMDAKLMGETITRNRQYIDNLDEYLIEMEVVHEQNSGIIDALQAIREKAVEATNIGNHDNLFTLGVNVRGIFEDMVNFANHDYNGHYLYSGTVTTEKALQQADPEGNGKPFEIVYGESTEDNLSGLSVEFHGNFNDRIINKDDISDEVINVKATELFGEGGIEVFEPIIKMYNLLTYKEDGTERERLDLFTKEDVAKIDEYQAAIANQIDELTRTNSRLGTKINRLTDIRDQMTVEELRLMEFKSLKSDTDVARATLDLKRDETALTYTLQVGSQLMSVNMFDFLS